MAECRGFKEHTQASLLLLCVVLLLLQPGQEGSGSWQQYINCPADRVVALPDGISDEAGAQFYVSG